MSIADVTLMYQSLKRQLGEVEYKKVLEGLEKLAEKEASKIPENKICEYSMPNLKPEPYHCKDPAKLPVEFNVATSYLCIAHFIHFHRNIMPYVSEEY